MEKRFKKDLKDGLWGQNIVAYRLALEGRKVEMSEGNVPGWDLKADGVKIEVKTDKKSHETGNIFLETECSGRPSGIKTTESLYWVTVEMATAFVWMVATSDLLAFMNRYHSLKDICRITGAGDGNACGYLIPKRYFTNPYMGRVITYEH